LTDRTTSLTDNSHATARGTTPAQRQTLIDVYRAEGNMAAAMRAAGIRSPRTAYLWWRRFEAAGEAGLVSRSRARRTQRRVPVEVAALVCELRRAHPDWGRRRIAQALRNEHGRQVVSPSGVESVLRRSGLWSEPTRPVPTAVAAIGRADLRELETLVPLAIEGIELGLRSEARAAVAALGGQVWARLGRDRQAWAHLLRDPAIGPLLLRSRIELARSLIGTGQWSHARDFLEDTLAWLRQGDSDGYDESSAPFPVSASLRRDDAWIDCYQYLGIVLRDRAPDMAASLLATALIAIRSTSRTLDPANPSLTVGNLERDLAKFGLRAGRVPDAEIVLHLRAARSSLEESGDRLMIAATDMAWGGFHARCADRAAGGERTRALEAMEMTVEQALATVAAAESPLLQTDFIIDAAGLLLVRGLPVNREALRTAAAHCLTYGYGGQARQLLKLPGIALEVSADVLCQLESIAAVHDEFARAVNVKVKSRS
jgi:transposase